MARKMPTGLGRFAFILKAGLKLQQKRDFGSCLDAEERENFPDPIL
jgi:hypothetical protein